ncbi:snare docking complex subunit [Pseudomassariella vexata]|uniref:Snare docking complex subunit n=1 Tax=Pseudomassariella vexata TaxID=1141098 RepID=A0A1Y2ECG9_9PEZI|nr:snare docking complex subunit [Pseudomassariella vexata]ORY68984.1 snare docking complex subunit [Pseudomassariella vexata]
MAVRGYSLRDRQISSLKKILNLNESVEQREDEDSVANGLAPAGPILTAEGEPIWKVLVFDDLGRDVISSVLRVSDLRSMGVTMHMHLSASRHPIPDVPVIYLLEPTPKNLEGITSDLQKSLYSPAYINFTSSIPRPLLEDFAAQTATAGTSEHIAQLFDQYLNFIVAEPDLFSLGMQKENTYWALNSAKTKDEELDHVVDKIVSGLFSVVVTMGVIPIIRCPKGAAAEMIAGKLDRKLRDHILNSKDNLFSSGTKSASSAGSTASRPVLIILDRNVDLNPMLSHSWTYQSLVHDVLNMKLNRITIETPVDEENPAKGVTKKAYDLAATDFFWEKNAGLGFPQAAEAIDAELTRYTQDAADITKKTGASSIEDLQNDTSASAQHLKAAITLLPELRERKATLDMHMNILAALLTGIKNRQLDNYYQMEENVMKQTKAQILEVIKDEAKGNQPLDKLRLFIIWFLSTEQEISRAEWTQFEEALKAADIDITSLAYIRQVRATTKMSQLTATNNPSQPTAQQGSDLFGRFSSLSNRFADRVKDAGVTIPSGFNLDSVTGAFKNLIPQNKDLTITQIVESIMDPQTASQSALGKTEGYMFFDPRSANARGTMPPPSALRAGTGTTPGSLPGTQGPGAASFGQRRQGYTDSIVFVVGGGSMDEYGNLQEWISRTSGERASKKRAIYGATEIMNATEFVKGPLESLGREMGS